MKKILIIILSLIALTVLTAQSFSPAIVSFTTGQVSPRLEARGDFAKYNSSCRTLENMFVHTQGPVSRRPGTRYIADANDGDYNVRLIPFNYSTDDNYVLSLENGYMGFFRTIE